MSLFKGNPWRNLEIDPLCKHCWEFVASPSMAPPGDCPCFGDTMGLVCHVWHRAGSSSCLVLAGKSMQPRVPQEGPCSVRALGNKILAEVRKSIPSLGGCAGWSVFMWLVFWFLLCVSESCCVPLISSAWLINYYFAGFSSGLEI